MAPKGKRTHQEINAPGSSAVSAPGSSAVSAPGSAAVSAPGSSAVSAPGSAAASVPGSSSVSAPGSVPGSSAVSAPGSSADSAPGSAPISSTGRRYFPEGVTFAILLRLPVKSLLRFKNVSTQWRTIISLPQFISQHLTRSPALLLIHTVTAPTTRALTRHFIARYEPPNPEPAIAHIPVHPGSDVAGPQILEVIGTTPNGIVCIAQELQATTLTLWNPATRSPRPIPPPALQYDPSEWTVVLGLAFGLDREDFNVIRIGCHVYKMQQPDVPEVFSLRTGSSSPTSRSGSKAENVRR